MQWIKSNPKLLSATARQSLALMVAANVAYVLDYFFNFAAGRLLQPGEFSIVVSLAGLSNVMVVGSRVVQTVVTRYVSRFEADTAQQNQLPSFFQAVWRSAWVWGTAVTLLLFLLSRPVANWLQIDDVRPVLALAATAVLLIVRPVIGGVLQGSQQFAHLGVVQIVQAIGRLALGIGLILLGWGAFGAMIALPVGSIVALIYGIWVVNPAVWRKTAVSHSVTIPELFRYSAYTAVGLLGYAILVNMDAILVRSFFNATDAGNYGAAVTLGKIVQFMPVAIVMLLFPKAAQRQAAKQDPAKVLLPAMGAVFALCTVIVVVYTFFTDLVVQLTVGNQYQVDSLVLGLLGTGLLLLALANVWLFYFLSIEQTAYLYLIWIGIGLQAGLMVLFHDALWQLPTAVVINGLFLTIGGAVIFWHSRRT